MMAERLWRGIARFEWRCSMRTWIYILARHAAVDQRDAQRRRARGAVPLSQAEDMSEVLQRVRTATQSFLRTEKRDAVRRLRDELAPEDRALLILRVDRGLPWRDVARVFAGAESADDSHAIDQEAARLRKRFQLLKEQLKARAATKGIP